MLARTQEVNLRFNKQKYKFSQSEVKFAGHVFGPDGLKPCESKVQTVVEMKSPECKKDLQRFLGMINFLGKFIPNLSTVNKPLRQLLEKNLEWYWTETHQQAFEELKCAITSAPVLKYYDVSAPVKSRRLICRTGSMSFTRQSTNCVKILEFC